MVTTSSSIPKSLKGGKYGCGGKVHKKMNKGGKVKMKDSACCAAAYLHEKAKMYGGK
jgi:hypothetical protein